MHIQISDKVNSFWIEFYICKVKQYLQGFLMQLNRDIFK